MTKPKRDGLDYWNSISEHRKADALKEQASAATQIAGAQIIQAQAAKQLAEAESSAHRAAADATRLQASIEQDKYNSEKKLRSSKNDILRLLKSTEIYLNDLSLLPGNTLTTVVNDRIWYRENRDEILNNLSYESDITDIERNFNNISQLDERFNSFDNKDGFLDLLQYFDNLKEYSIAKADFEKVTLYCDSCVKKEATLRVSINNILKKWESNHPSSREEFINIAKRKSIEYKNIQSNYTQLTNCGSAAAGLIFFSIATNYLTNFPYSWQVLIGGFVFMGWGYFFLMKEIERLIHKINFEIKNFDDHAEISILIPKIQNQCDSLINSLTHLVASIKEQSQKLEKSDNYSTGSLKQFFAQYPVPSLN
jgi:hypothetical protein